MSDGESWINNGWKLEEQLRRDYFYYCPKQNKLISKQSRKKSNVNTPTHMTEWEHAQKDGLIRIWDCGKLRLRYDG